MAKTIAEIEKLKREWENDPCWDLYETEGFEEHREELMAHQQKYEAKWEEMRLLKEKELDAKADKLGVRGLYRLIEQYRELLDKHNRAIEAIAAGHNHQASKILRGYED